MFYPKLCYNEQCNKEVLCAETWMSSIYSPGRDRYLIQHVNAQMKLHCYTGWSLPWRLDMLYCGFCGVLAQTKWGLTSAWLHGWHVTSLAHGLIACGKVVVPQFPMSCKTAFENVSKSLIWPSLELKWNR